MHGPMYIKLIEGGLISAPKVSPPCSGGGGAFLWLCDPENYAGGSVATGRASHAGQVEG